MTDYHFTGAYPRVLAGLSQGVNATISPAHGDAPSYGATLEASPGDAIHTDEPYEHPELEEVEFAAGGLVPNGAGTDTIPVPVDQGYVIPAPAHDPAHDSMTAEGAPAPAEPTA